MANLHRPANSLSGLIGLNLFSSRLEVVPVVETGMVSRFWKDLRNLLFNSCWVTLPFLPPWGYEGATFDFYTKLKGSFLALPRAVMQCYLIMWHPYLERTTDANPVCTWSSGRELCNGGVLGLITGLMAGDFGMNQNNFEGDKEEL